MTPPGEVFRIQRESIHSRGSAQGRVKRLGGGHYYVMLCTTFTLFAFFKATNLMGHWNGISFHFCNSLGIFGLDIGKHLVSQFMFIDSTFHVTFVNVKPKTYMWLLQIVLPSP